MARHALRNETWGFDSSCFVCEPRNATGLRIPFFHDDDERAVVAEFTLDESFSGAPSCVHGGISLAILDEAQAWATIAVGGKFAVTAETTTRFERPVRVGRTYTVRAVVDAQDEARIATSAEIRDGKDRACAVSTASFVVLSPAQAVDAIGAELSDAEAGYLRDA